MIDNRFVKNIHILLDVLLCSIAEYFYVFCRELLSNTPNCYVRVGELCGFLLTGNA